MKADGGHLGGDASIHSMHVTEKAEMAFCVCERTPLPPSLVITDIVQPAGPHLTPTRQDEDPQANGQVKRLRSRMLGCGGP